MIDAVVFDMDGVLCRYQIDRRQARLAEWSGRSADEIHAAIWRSGFEDASERGEWEADAYLREFGARMGYPLSADQWIEARRISVEADEEVLAVARRVGEQRPIAMLTNNGFLLKRHIAAVFPAVPAIFGQNAIFSAELGRAKPDPEAFRRLAARLGHAPERLLFFDDGATYVAGAREAGLAAHLFEGAAALRATLASYGIEP